MINLPLGQIVATQGITHLLRTEAAFGECVGNCLCRHQRGDWGEIGAEDRALNDEAALPGSCQRVLSAYLYGETRFWIITEADRSITTVLLPEEY